MLPVMMTITKTMTTMTGELVAARGIGSCVANFVFS